MKNQVYCFKYKGDCAVAYRWAGSLSLDYSQISTFHDQMFSSFWPSSNSRGENKHTSSLQRTDIQGHWHTALLTDCLEWLNAQLWAKRSTILTGAIQMGSQPACLTSSRRI